MPSFDISLKLIEPNLNNLVFSKRVLFVEGDDDYVAVKATFEILDLTPSYLGLEILRLGGFGNIVHLAPYAKNFCIPYAMLLDASAEQTLRSIDPQGNTWRLLSPDLEGALNTEKHSSNSIHIAKTIKSYGDWSNLKKCCPNFANSLEQALSIIDISI